MAFSSPNMASASALHSSVLPTPVGPEEDEGADRALGVLQAHPAAADGLGDGRDGLVLADDALVQDLFHAQQALALLLGQAGAPGCRSSSETISAMSSGDHLAVAARPLFCQSFLRCFQLALAACFSSSRSLAARLEVLRVDRRRPFLRPGRLIFFSSSLHVGGAR